jgi:peptide/nickel transport system permease protein
VTLWVLRRFGLLLVAIGVTSVVIFVLLRLLPGDLAKVIGGTEATPQQVATIREQLGLDRPLVRQYLDWVGGILHGDFGASPLSGETVTGDLGDTLSITLPLVFASTVLSIVVAVPLGIVAGARHRKADGVALSAVSQLGIAIPSFWAGLILIVVFAVKWGVLPAGSFPRDGWDDSGQAMKSLVLPTVTLALAQGAVLLRFVRSATLDVLHQDYIRTARAKGLTRTQALYRHGLRNAALPIISILGVQIASLISGVVIIERVFNLPGVGQMLLNDIGQRDLEKVQGTVLLLAVIVLVIGFLVDVLHRVVDPRLRVGS